MFRFKCKSGADMELRTIIEKFKYPILVLCIGLVLLFLPNNTNESTNTSGADESLARILSSTEGVGEARVLVSEKGAVVVCPGAKEAAVRLKVVEAVSTYTGFNSDRIIVLQMAKGN